MEDTKTAMQGLKEFLHQWSSLDGKRLICTVEYLNQFIDSLLAKSEPVKPVEDGIDLEKIIGDAFEAGSQYEFEGTVLKPGLRKAPNRADYIKQALSSLPPVPVKDVPVMQWVNAGDRIPESWHLKHVRFVHTKAPILDIVNFLKNKPKIWLCEIEWLDENLKDVEGETKTGLTIKK